VTDAVKLSNNGTDFYEILTVNSNFGDLSDVDMTSVAPSEGDIAYFDGSNWVAQPWTIQGASGVSTSAESSGDILLYNGTNYVNTPHVLNNVTDVTITTVATGDMVYYDGAGWANQANSVDNLTNVSLTAAADGDLLLYNGTNWVDVAHTLSNITDVSLTSATSGEFLKFDGTNWINASIPEINTLNDIGNVTITSVASGDSIQWSGAAWVNYDPLASPALTGTPTAPTATAGTNTTQIATTEFVSTAVADLVDSAPGTLDTLNELAAALGDDANFSTTVTNSLALKAPLASPTFTGTVTLPQGTNVRSGIQVASASITLSTSHAGATIRATGTGAKTITVPANATSAIPIGTSIPVFREGSGTVAFSAASGVTIHTPTGLSARQQYSVMVITKILTDTWVVSGDAT
jgi:hypothetical protein